MTTTLFTNAHIATGEPGSTAASTLPLQDILVTDGVFTAFGPGLAQQYEAQGCLLYTSPSPRDPKTSRMPSSA